MQVLEARPPNPVTGAGKQPSPRASSSPCAANSQAKPLPPGRQLGRDTAQVG
jgi:hypothetical protein